MNPRAGTENFAGDAGGGGAAIPNSKI